MHKNTYYSQAAIGGWVYLSRVLNGWPFEPWEANIDTVVPPWFLIMWYGFMGAFIVVFM